MGGGRGGIHRSKEPAKGVVLVVGLCVISRAGGGAVLSWPGMCGPRSSTRQQNSGGEHSIPIASAIDVTTPFAECSCSVGSMPSKLHLAPRSTAELLTASLHTLLDVPRRPSGVHSQRRTDDRNVE